MSGHLLFTTTNSNTSTDNKTEHQRQDCVSTVSTITLQVNDTLSDSLQNDVATQNWSGTAALTVMLSVNGPVRTPYNWGRLIQTFWLMFAAPASLVFSPWMRQYSPPISLVRMSGLILSTKQKTRMNSSRMRTSPPLQWPSREGGGRHPPLGRHFPRQTPPAPFHAGIHTPLPHCMLGYTSTTVNRMTDRWKNITSFASGKNRSCALHSWDDSNGLFTVAGTKTENKWVAWNNVEAFTLHLNQDRDWDLYKVPPIVLVPITVHVPLGVNTPKGKVLAIFTVLLVTSCKLSYWLDPWFCLYYRPQRSCEGYVFTPVCHSVHRGVRLSACWDTTLREAHTPPPPGDGCRCWRYASYWNAFFILMGFLLCESVYT